MQTLELAMIVRNGSAGLARCLSSVHGIVDRITIGDTGSTDDTLEIARQHGAKIIPVVWQNDFAAARNAVLANATCSWVMFLDADEMLDPHAASRISALIEDTSVAGYEVTAWNYVNDAGFRSSGEQARTNPIVIPEAAGYSSYFPSSNTRLFRRDPGIYFEHCVHESVADRIDALGLRRVPADLLIHHFGYVEDAEATRTEKEQRYYRLALKKVAASPNSYQANLGAGMAELDHAKQAEPALAYFRRAEALAPHLSTGWLYAGICLTRLGRHAEALTHLQRAVELEPANLLAASSLGDVYFQQGAFLRAGEAYAGAAALGDASPLSLAKLGASQIHLGDRESGMGKMREAIGSSPDNAELYDIYATAAFLGGFVQNACDAAKRRLAMKKVSAFNFLVAATLFQLSHLQDEADSIARDGLARFPDDCELREFAAGLRATGASGSR